VLVQVKEILQQLRTALKQAGGQYVLGSFSYADIVMAIPLQGLFDPEKPRLCVPVLNATPC
jgi:glutathione S-transferase